MTEQQNTTPHETENSGGKRFLKALAAGIGPDPEPAGGCEGCREKCRHQGTARKTEVVIKFAAEPETTRQCPVCGNKFYQTDKTWAYLEGTETPVCLDCAGPEMAGLLKTKENHAQSLTAAKDAVYLERMAHYQTKSPELFTQIDAFMDPENFDDGLLTPGPDGVAVTGCETWELMSGIPEVRVLARADIGKAEALRGLKSAYDAISGGFMDDHFEQDKERRLLETENFADPCPF